MVYLINPISYIDTSMIKSTKVKQLYGLNNSQFLLYHFIETNICENFIDASTIYEYLNDFIILWLPLYSSELILGFRRKKIQQRYYNVIYYLRKEIICNIKGVDWLMDMKVMFGLNLEKNSNY